MYYSKIFTFYKKKEKNYILFFNNKYIMYKPSFIDIGKVRSKKEKKQTKTKQFTKQKTYPKLKKIHKKQNELMYLNIK